MSNIIEKTVETLMTSLIARRNLLKETSIKASDISKEHPVLIEIGEINELTLMYLPTITTKMGLIDFKDCINYSYTSKYIIDLVNKHTKELV